MQAVERLSSYITQGVYTVSGPFHPFGGAVDIIVVEQQDGSFKSSPWYVRFGKFLGVLKTREMVVKILVNGTEAGFHMYLDHKGEAFFLKEYDSDGEEVGLSPPSSGDEMDEGSSNGLSRKNRLASCETESISQIDMENGKIVGRTDSRRSTFLGLVFGKKPAKEEDGGNGNMPRLNSLERAEIAADLLETKWSTNLPITSLNFGKAQKVGNESGTSNESCKEEIASPSVCEGDAVTSDAVHKEHFGELKTEFSPSLRTHGEVLEVYTSENGDIVNRHGLFSDIASEIDASNLETAVADSAIMTEQIVDIQSSEFTLVSDDNNGLSNKPGDSSTVEEFMEEGGGRENASYIFYETIQSSTVRIDVADDMMDLTATSSNGHDNVKHNSEVAVDSIDLISKVEPILTQEAPSNAQHSAKHYGFCENSQIPSENSVVGLSPDRDSLKHHPFRAEPSSKDMEDEKIEELGSKKMEDAKLHILVGEVQPEERQLDQYSPNIAEFQSHLSTSPDTSKESKDSSVLPDSSNIRGEDGETKTVEGLETDTIYCSGEDRAVIGVHGPRASSTFDDVATPRSLLLSASEDEQVLFSDVDNYAAGEFSSQFPIEEEGDSEEHLFLETEANSEGEMSQDIIEDDSPTDLHEVPVTPTTPIGIPIKRNSSEESDRTVRSLPNVPSQIHHFDMSDDCYPLSSSVQLNSPKFEQDDSRKGSHISEKLEESSPIEQVQAESSTEYATEEIKESEAAGVKKDKPDKPTVEISLCRHLLLEGMGMEAASKAFESEKVDFEKFVSLGPSIVKNNRLIVRISGRYFPWNVAAPIILGMVSFDKDHIFESESIRVEKPTSIVPSGGPWGLWPFRFTKSRSMMSDRNSGDENKDKIAEITSGDGSPSANDNPRPKHTRKRVRFITPSPEELESLKLNEGRNSVTFSFESAMLGKQQVDARIYLWKWNTRIVVSDVDGTITKSDVLGQFMPLMGKDWSQTGVAHLFSSIKDNGYEFIFLSARAIAQAYITRQFLFNLKQDGKSLPDGPVVISPDGLFPSLYREVIRRAPHEFKISCLEEIRALFPTECNPFYAGFGNRHTDEISYLKVGIPKGKIFIINPRGQVAVNHLVDTRSYTTLNALVNGMFPPTSAEQEEYNAWNYWRLPLPDID